MATTAQRHEHIIHTMGHNLRQANEKLALEQVSDPSLRSISVVRIHHNNQCKHHWHIFFFFLFKGTGRELDEREGDVEAS